MKRRLAYHGTVLIAAVSGLVIGAAALASSAPRPIIVKPSASIQTAQNAKAAIPGRCARVVIYNRSRVLYQGRECGLPAHGTWYCAVTPGVLSCGRSPLVYPLGASSPATRVRVQGRQRG